MTPAEEATCIVLWCECDVSPHLRKHVMTD
jgi:hypothetical protein